MSREEARKALQAFESRLGPVATYVPVVIPSLEELFTSPDYFGIDTATPLQRAICRICDGVPLGELANAEWLKEAISSWTSKAKVWDGHWVAKPEEIVLLAATRSGKTRLAISQAVRLALTCSLKGLKIGEVPRVPIVSVSLDLAHAAYGQLREALLTQPKLHQFLVGIPTADSIVLRHPSGRNVEITVSAGKRAGSSLVARWLAGAVFDEAPRMSGSDDGSVINLDDSLAAIRSRLLPGAQVLLMGGPWAPSGTVYKKVQDSHGTPSARLVIFRAKGAWLNPIHWTEERMKSLRLSHHPADQLSYRTDCEAEWADPEAGLLSAAEVDACMTRQEFIIPAKDGVIYAAAIDPAVRLNAWSLVVKHREGGKEIIDFIKQWHRRGNEGPLDADIVCGEMAKDLAPYRVKNIATDKWQVDTLTSLARRHGLNLIEYDYNSQELTELYLDMAAKVSRGLVDLPSDVDMRGDLLGCRRRITTTGMVIDLPVSGNGRHSDYVPSLARVLRQYTPDSAPVPKPRVTEADKEKQLIHLAERHFLKKGKHWWQS